MNNTSSTYQPIASYGIIGDCHTTALVSSNGSIDWYCPGRFDAPAVFCRLLDARKGGFCDLSPASGYTTTRQYSGETNILETVFTTGGSMVRVVDFMPVHQRSDSRHGYDVGTSRRILRLIEGIAGETEMKVSFFPTFDFAQGKIDVEINGAIPVAHKDAHYMSISIPGSGMIFQADNNGKIYGQFTVKNGERKWLILTEADDPDRVVEMPSSAQCEDYYSRTRHYWEMWSSHFTYRGPFRNEILRSSLTLKLLTYEPTGAIVAAPTTSLPEEIGGIRNWDYRYAWARDSALILYALMNVGYHQEAADFFEWLVETHHKNPRAGLQVLYGIDGKLDLDETIIDLEGYERSRPVRVGNAAAGQSQLDINGEILTAAYLYFTSGIGKRKQGHNNNDGQERRLQHDWGLLRGLVEQTVARWQESDNGIWEVRGKLQPFLYSKLMCWAAIDRGIRLSKEYMLEAPLDKWEKAEKEIRRQIITRGYNSNIGAFTQAFNSTALDASVLLIPRTGLLAATDKRIETTINTLQSKLTRNGLMYRYRTEDGLPGNEGIFLACTFWLVDALALSGKLDEAHDLFDKASRCSNDLGLFSEETDILDNTLLGNFPQGFSHMAHINAAVNLAKITRHGPEKVAETETERAAKAGPAAIKGYSR